VLWTALIDGVALATVDPRLLLRTFTEAWPAELNASVANRISAVVVGRVIHQFLPVAEQDDATGAGRRGRRPAARAGRARLAPPPSWPRAGWR
jgi:hypothetical protein